MDRENATQEFKWNLIDIFKNEDEFNENLKKIQEKSQFILNFKGKLKKPGELYNYYRLSDEIEMLENKLANYIMLNHDIDLNNNKFLEYEQQLNLINTNIAKMIAYIEPELASLSSEYFNNLLSDERFKDYEYKIKAVLNNRKHILNEEQESALATVHSYADGFANIMQTLTQSDFKFEPVKIDGKMEDLTESTYGKFLTSKDRNARLTAYNNLYKVYNQFSKTLAINYIYFVKLVNADLSLRNYNSTFEMFNNTNQIPYALFKNLTKNVEKHLNFEQKYFKLLKKSTKIKNFTFADVYQSIANSIEKHYEIDEQKQIVLKALVPLGNEYQKLLKTAYNNNWIDFCTNKNKRSGGYMTGVYGVHPYVLLNDNGNYDSLSTLAHELGHAMHTYFSSKYQPFAKHDYDIFIAEIASTVNEILLNKYMINNSQSKEEKLFYIDNYLQHFKSTVFRQTMFGEFEDFAHSKVLNGEILSPNILDAKYKELLQKHFKNTVIIDDNIIHEWERIPHFYSPYYVYKYATSFISAVNIANSILENKNNMIEKYMQILKSGSDGYPTEILAKAGIDLTKDETYEYAFDDMKNCLKEAEKLINELYK